MKNKFSKMLLFITIVTFALLSVIFIGCPATTKTEDKATTTTTTIIAWSGTYTGSGGNGTLVINQLPDNKIQGQSTSTSGTTNISGTSTVTNNNFSGTLSGVSPSNASIILTISGTISGSSMSGTYITTLTNNTVTDSGRFSLTKQ